MVPLIFVFRDNYFSNSFLSPKKRRYKSYFSVLCIRHGFSLRLGSIQSSKCWLKRNFNPLCWKMNGWKVFFFKSYFVIIIKKCHHFNAKERLTDKHESILDSVCSLWNSALWTRNNTYLSTMESYYCFWSHQPSKKQSHKIGNTSRPAFYANTHLFWRKKIKFFCPYFQSLQVRKNWKKSFNYLKVLIV